MKHVPLFRDFLTDVVNLNETRVRLLEESVEALKSFICESVVGEHVSGFDEQGSWAHDTIIKPVGNREFDADLLVYMNPVLGWSAADYVINLGKIFKNDGRYKDKFKVDDYCVTITYAGVRKIDLAPCVVERLYDGQLEVCNRRYDRFEQSEPIRYTNWLKQANAYSGLNSFRKVTRLVKYLRNIKQRFTCSSVLLTTLLANQIQWYDKGTEAFSDTPTTLKTLFGRLDDWLQARSIKPRVDNPFLIGVEDFAASLTQDQYANFRAFVHKYRGWIDDAFDCQNRWDSIVLWRKVFGEEFAARETVLAADAMTEEASPARGFLISTAAHLDNLVDAVKQRGLTILPMSFRRPPHMKEPTWRRAGIITPNVNVSATWHPSRQSLLDAQIVVSGEALPAKGGLWFTATVNNGQEVPLGYRVEWRITNTGAAAMRRQAGRGDFYISNKTHRRWEELEYRGVHMTEAFIVSMANETLVGQSAPFFVLIE